MEYIRVIKKQCSERRGIINMHEHVEIKSMMHWTDVVGWWLKRIELLPLAH